MEPPDNYAFIRKIKTSLSTIAAFMLCTNQIKKCSRQHALISMMLSF